MRKLIYALLAVAIIAGGSVSIARANDNDHDGREKISGPSQIRNFRDIVKRGNDLFGFRIAAMLEKIHTPGDMKNYENIRKIGGSLFGYRKIAGSAMVTADARACVGAAITKKDRALKSALNSFTSSTNASIDGRMNCQLDAITRPSAMEQQSANMTCKANFEASAKTNLQTLATARDNALRTYKSEIKACGGANGEIKLEDGSNIEKM